jgi:hypothetical protein
VAAPKAAAPAAPAEPKSQEFPGFPKLLWQTRSKVTGDPVRVIELPDGPGILGAGEALMCMPIPGLVGSRLLLLDDTSNIHRLVPPNGADTLVLREWGAGRQVGYIAHAPVPAVRRTQRGGAEGCVNHGIGGVVAVCTTPTSRAS